VTDCNRPPSRGKCVRDDWRAWFPDEKAQVFHKEVRQPESSCAMLSVSLDEAIELWQLGHSGKSLASCRHSLGPLQGADPDARWLASCFVRTRQALWNHSQRCASRSREFSGAKRSAVGTHEQPARPRAAFPKAAIPSPESQLVAFQNAVREQSQLQEAHIPSRQPVIRHRRMTSIAGE
jgi:hypothetical protein